VTSEDFIDAGEMDRSKNLIDHPVLDVQRSVVDAVQSLSLVRPGFRMSDFGLALGMG